MNAVGGQIARTRPISIAILAMGGEGGGVLADWIVDLAEHGNYLAQATSVPGVAQRTGATIYYVELFPKAEAQAAGRDPVFALMPTPGDVDVVIASELMEAGRAVQRGLVTPDRTTLIASTHRVYAITEKSALADGRVDAAALDAACRAAARRFIAFDMAALAEATNSVISAVLFGALAGSGVLPFQRMAFEAAVHRGGVGVSQSLAAFAAGYAGVDVASAALPATTARPDLPPVLQHLLAPIESRVPADVLELVRAGVERLADYQDVTYARIYLERLQPFIARARTDDTRLLAEVARQLALAMSYEDTIRVAELKTRRARFERVRAEVQIKDSQLLEIAEFMHPRTQELADTLPAPVGRWLLRSAWSRPLLDRITRSGRVVKTTSVGGFLLMRIVAAFKSVRPRSLRYAREQQSLSQWLKSVACTAERDQELAIEAARARGLVKGYGDTYERGLAKFDLLLACLPPLIGRHDAAVAFAKLRKAALADENGKALRKAIETSHTLSSDSAACTERDEQENPTGRVRAISGTL